jgi:predicted Ser/Thr protein kinase
MICPHCRLGNLDLKTGRCDRCEYEAPAQDTLDLPPDDLSREVKRLLESEYHIERLLGRGGMSLVYLAREVELNRLVALKVLPIQMAFGTQSVDRFKREAKIAASLDHPHIVPVFRVGTTSGLLWYAMKYIRGRSLRQVMEPSGPMSFDICLDVIAQLASALEYAHRRGVVHRDIKPENVLIDGHGWIWLSDFGIAKAFGAVPLTHTGGTLGTPSYMSPEQCLGQTLDARADQYSLAILTYQCLAGRLPFEGNSVGDMIQKQCFQEPPTLSSARPDISEQFSQVLRRAMSKKREDRFPSVVAFVEALGARISLEAARQALQEVVAHLPEPPSLPRIESVEKAAGAAQAAEQPRVEAAPAAAAASAAAKKPVATPWRRFEGAVAIALGGVLAVLTIAQWRPRADNGVVPTVSSASGRTDSVAPSAQHTSPVTPPAGQPARDTGAHVRPPPKRVPAPTVAHETAEPAPEPVQLTVRTAPMWAFLFIDDRQIGYTNAPNTITPGRHTIRIEQEGFKTYQQEVTVAPGRAKKLAAITLEPIRP